MISRQLWTVLVFLILAAPTSVVADRVTPNDRVDTRLRVREEPNTTSTIRDFLYPGQSADLERSVPYWYEVILDDGTPGFVSKAFSSVLPSVLGTQAVRLSAWNIKKLGHGSAKDYPLVAQIIEENLDILAVVEIMQKSRSHPGYDNLITQLGVSWAGQVTTEPRPNTNSGSAEFYAVVYRVARVTPCAGWTELVRHGDNDGGSNGTGADDFSREPAVGCFVADNFDFLLAPYHATWSEGDIEDISSEVRNLEEVFAFMATAQPGEEDLLIAGDLNLVPSDLEAAIGREVPTSGIGSTLNGSGERTQNLFDHLVISDTDATTEMIGTAEILDVRNQASDNQIFFRTISDHLPLVAQFRSSVPDDD